MTTEPVLSLGDKVLVAALLLSNAEIARDFTAEDLAVEAWRQDRLAFGLRGYEREHPDSNKVYTKIDGQSGLVTKGWLVKSGERTLRITEAGLSRAVTLSGSRDSDLQAKLERTLQDSVNRILNHPELQAWLEDRAKPARFRGAGHFWGIAPGTPAQVVRARILGVEKTLQAALEVLTQRGAAEVMVQRGRVLFERRDIELCLEFQRALRTRFRSDLKVLDPEFDYQGATQ